MRAGQRMESPVAQGQPFRGQGAILDDRHVVDDIIEYRRPDASTVGLRSDVSCRWQVYEDADADVRHRPRFRIVPMCGSQWTFRAALLG